MTDDGRLESPERMHPEARQSFELAEDVVQFALERFDSVVLVVCRTHSDGTSTHALARGKPSRQAALDTIQALSDILQQIASGDVDTGARAFGDLGPPPS